MSTYTPVTKVIGTTGASGANGFNALITAQNAAVAAAVTTAQGVTGVAPQSISISPAQLLLDTTSTLFEMIQTLSYTVIS